MKEKPVSILLETAKNEYAEAINEITNKHNLSYYFLWLIFKDFLVEIEKNKNIELQKDILEYNKEEGEIDGKDTISK